MQMHFNVLHLPELVEYGHGISCCAEQIFGVKHVELLFSINGLLNIGDDGDLNCLTSGDVEPNGEGVE